MRKKFVIWSVVVVVIALGVGYYKWDNDRSVRQRREQAALRAETDRQKVMRGNREGLLKILEPLAAGDPEAETLLAFFKEHATLAHYRDDGRFSLEQGRSYDRVFDAGSEVRDFFIALHPRAERYKYGFGGVANFEYSQEANTVFVPSLVMVTPLWMGSRFLHEVRHVYDYLTGIEPYSTTLTREYVMGEVRGHGLEIRMLNRATSGGFLRAIQSFVQTNAPVPADFPRRWYMPANGLKSMSHINAAFDPAQSLDEEESRAGSMFIAINFYYADLLGLGEEGKIEFYTNYQASKESVR